MKKILPLLVCALMTASALSGCGVKYVNDDGLFNPLALKSEQKTQSNTGKPVFLWNRNIETEKIPDEEPAMNEKWEARLSGWSDYFSSIEESGDHVVIKDGRCTFGYDMLNEFFAEIDAGRKAVLKYTVAEYGEPMKREGTVAYLDPAQERRRIGRIVFDGEKFYDNGTDYYPEKTEYSYEAGCLKKGIDELDSETAFACGYDSTECVYLTSDASASCIYAAADPNKKHTLADAEADGVYRAIFGFKVGWGEDKRISGEVMRFDKNSDKASLIERLKAEGYVIDHSSDGIFGYDRLVEFYENTQKGINDTLKYALFYQGDVSSSGEDSLYLTVLDYNGKYFTKVTRDIDSSEIYRPDYWKYLKREQEKLREGARHDFAEHFYLVNDSSRNWKDIERAMVSSDSSVAFAFAWTFVISNYYD